tara:strand:- start:107 stop:334 length:228 start_codon:yes stop_codon:yes gene_type:complete
MAMHSVLQYRREEEASMEQSGVIILIATCLGFFLGYFIGRYKSNRHHEEEIHSIRGHYEVKLKKKNLEERLRQHG